MNSVKLQRVFPHCIISSCAPHSMGAWVSCFYFWYFARTFWKGSLVGTWKCICLVLFHCSTKGSYCIFEIFAHFSAIVEQEAIIVWLNIVFQEEPRKFFCTSETTALW